VRVCEYPGYRHESLERDYRTVMVMPMNCTDFDGRPMVLTVISRTLMEMSEEDRVFLGMIIHLGAISVERQRQLEAERRAAQRLGISFNTAQQMIIVDYGAKAKQAKNLHHNVARILQRAGMQASVIIVDNGLVCLVPADGERLGKIKRQIADDLAHYLGAEPILLASGICRQLGDYPSTWKPSRPTCAQAVAARPVRMRWAST